MVATGGMILCFTARGPTRIFRPLGRYLKLIKITKKWQNLKESDQYSGGAQSLILQCFIRNNGYHKGGNLHKSPVGASDWSQKLSLCNIGSKKFVSLLTVGSNVQESGKRHYWLSATDSTEPQAPLREHNQTQTAVKK